LQVPVGAARRDLEGCVVAANAVTDARSNINAALNISRGEQLVNLAVVFIGVLLGQKEIRGPIFLRNTVHLLLFELPPQGDKRFRQPAIRNTFVTFI
jgi:hypothetical protein